MLQAVIRSKDVCLRRLVCCLHDVQIQINFINALNTLLYRGADKSLARPGRKQTTATKFGIYLTR